MTESTPPLGPPPGHDDDPDATAPDFDALELVHASVDGELTADEEAAVSPDESWRTQVEEARAAQDTVQKALAVPPVDEARREAHIAAALAAFDELSVGDPIAVPPPASQQHQDPSQQNQDRGDETGGSGDELAHRRRAREWLRRAPLGIAAAILAAVVVVGATQFADDDSDTDTVAVDADSDDDTTDDGFTAAPTADDAALESGGEDTSAESEDGAVRDGADQTSAGAGMGMVSYALDDEPGSLDLFVDRVFGMAGGDEGMQARATEQDHLDLGPRCSENAVVDLAANQADKPNLTLVQGVLDGRDVVGVIDRADPTQVTIIDLDRCAVVAVRSP